MQSIAIALSQALQTCLNRHRSSPIKGLACSMSSTLARGGAHRQQVELAHASDEPLEACLGEPGIRVSRLQPRARRPRRDPASRDRGRVVRRRYARRRLAVLFLPPIPALTCPALASWLGDSTKPLKSSVCLSCSSEVYPTRLPFGNS